MFSLWPAGSLCSGLSPTKEEIRLGKLASLGDHALTPRDATRALNLFGTIISIVNPSTSFSVMAKVNDSPVVFLLDTGSALTILRRNVWERCRLSTQQLQPWNRKKLVGAGGAFLHVYGWTTIEIDVKGEKFSQSVVIVDPLATEAILGLDVLGHCVIDLSLEQLITGAGHVVNLYCKEPIGKQDSVEGQQHDPVLAKIDCNEQSQDSVKGLQHGVAHPLLTKIDGKEQSQEQNIVEEPMGKQDSVEGQQDSVEGQQHDPVLAKMDCNEQSQDSVKGLQHGVAHPVLTKIDGKEQSQEQNIVEGQQHKVDHPTLVTDDSVLFVRVVANSRIPSFSEMEILGTVVGEAPDKTYLLQSQLKDSDLMIATAVVTPGGLIPMRVKNPTGQPVMLYKGTKVASLCGVEEVVSCQQSLPVSAVHGNCDEVPPIFN